MSSSEQVAQWVGDVDPNMPLRKAARRILRARLKAVERAVRAARHEAREKDVHQLRVACRRADAVLAALRDVIKIGRIDKARKWIRAVRRSAGDVRAHDVHLAGLAAILSSPPATIEREAAEKSLDDGGVDRRSESPIALAGEYVHDRLLQARETALNAFHHTLDDLDMQRFRALRKRIVRSLKRARVRLHESGCVEDSFIETPHAADPVASAVPPDPTPRASGGQPGRTTLRDAARMALPRFVDDVLAAAGEELSNPEHLHSLRIKGKALRYGIEIFSSCLSEATIAEAYPVAADLQERLGRINDGYELLRVIDDVLAELGGGARPELGGAAHESGGLLAGVLELHARERTALDAARHQFTEWWRGTLAADVLGRLERMASRLTSASDIHAPGDEAGVRRVASAERNRINPPDGQARPDVRVNGPAMTPQQREAALIEVRLKSRPLDDLIEGIRAGQERDS